MNCLLKVFFVLLYVSTVNAQLDCTFKHYSTANGLSQSAVRCMLQSKNGMMWFSTWNGLNRFDGYSFKTYKGDNKVLLSNSRIEEMIEDKFGFIWLRDFNDLIYRFDPTSEKFEEINFLKSKYQNSSKIYGLSNGHIWLVTKEDGVVCLKTNETNFSIREVNHYHKNEEFDVETIYDIWVDLQKNEWILTNNGLYTIAFNSAKMQSFFASGNKYDRNSFYSYYEDQNRICFGSDEGKVYYYTKSSSKFGSFAIPTSSRITYLHPLLKDDGLIATQSDGFFVYNSQNKNYTHYNKKNSGGLLSDSIFSVYMDKRMGVWFDLEEKGVVRFNPVTNTLKSYRMDIEKGNASGSISHFRIFEDVNNYLWVQPYGGGFSFYDWDNETLSPFYNKDHSPDSKYSNKLHSALSDRQGNLWLSTHSKGLEKISFVKKDFELQPIHTLNYATLKNNVRVLFKDSNDCLWVSTRDGLLHLYNKHNIYLGYLTNSGKIARTGKGVDGTIYSIIQDSSGDFWFGTRGQGLIYAKCQRESKEYSLLYFKHNANDNNSISCDNIYDLYEDNKHNIWVGTFDGGPNLIKKENRGNTIINKNNYLKNYPSDCLRIRSISTDTLNNILLGTTSGLVVFSNDFTSIDKIVFNNYSHTPGDNHTLSDNDILSISKTKKGDVYCVTMGGGLNKVTIAKDNKVTFKSYTMKDGLPSDVLVAMQEDLLGNLWITSENILCKFDPIKEKAESYPQVSDINALLFNEATATISNDGKLFFGTDKGILSFFPDSIQKDTYAPEIVFTQFLLKNDPMILGEHNISVKNDIRKLDKLVFSHKQNNFTIGFSAIDFRGSENIKYAYRLKGIEDEWIYLGSQHSANFINLPHGKYQFEVRSTNSAGIWMDNIQSIDIEIKPAIWKTPLAYVCYFICSIFLIILISYVLFTIYRLKLKVKIEQQITDIKLHFFTNVSHELRTPLTLISAPIEHLLNKHDLSAKVREQLLIVEKNTNRMQHLVNQILDFRKIQSKKMKMKVQQVDLVEFVRRIMDNFKLIAVESNIHFAMECDVSTVMVWLDADKSEKIIFNLLSNAFKFTLPHKSIVVIVKDSKESVSISVQDQGIGIDETKIAPLFNRFEHTIDKNRSIFNQPNSGIGLSLVKELTEMHNASISVKSKLGKGSCFTVTFQKGKDHYKDADFIVSDSVDQRVDLASQKEEIYTDEEQHTAGLLSKTMLIVEDNKELRQFLRSAFSHKFNILEAENGVIGVAKAIKYIPDIIISDIMMAEKEGTELVRDLRSNLNTSHIPIIILTAKDTIEPKLESLNLGADDYILKPFSSKHLEARVDNLLSLRAKLYQHYLANGKENIHEQEDNRTELPLNGISSTDRSFLDKLVDFIKESMDNSKIHVNELPKEFCMSRSSFFKKVKALTGYSPIDFIKEMKMKQAMYLIKENKLSISEISYLVGFDDPKYFSRVFKQKFNMAPSEYRDSLS